MSSPPRPEAQMASAARRCSADRAAPEVSSPPPLWPAPPPSGTAGASARSIWRARRWRWPPRWPRPRPGCGVLPGAGHPDQRDRFGVVPAPGRPEIEGSGSWPKRWGANSTRTWRRGSPSVGPVPRPTERTSPRVPAATSKVRLGRAVRLPSGAIDGCGEAPTGQPTDTDHPASGQRVPLPRHVLWRGGWPGRPPPGPGGSGRPGV